jgi:adenylate cyclase
MGVEIERKFLVDPEAFAPPSSGTTIRQGWLVRDPERTVRVRLSGPSGDAAGPTRAYLTVKGPDGLVRSEYEYEIPPDDAVRLLDDLCLPGQINKVRYRVPVGRHTFEVDVYSGRQAGLITAEVELPDTDTAVDVPDWAVQEVTGDPQWTNAALSRPPAGA